MNERAIASSERPRVEIACDESGFVGGSLFGGVRVFAHASVRIGRSEALDLVDRVRRHARADENELKASRLNRPWGRHVAGWLLAPDGPLSGRAAVHVTDTRLFGLARLAQVSTLDAAPPGWWGADRDAGAWHLALRLHRRLAEVPAAQERCFLEAARDLLWINRRSRLRAVPASWPDVVAGTAASLPDARDRDAVAGLASPQAIRRLGDYLASPPASPLTEPLLPALGWAIQHWSAWGDPEVVHDEQSLLTPARVGAIGAALSAAHPGRRLAGFTRVDSRTDARVQLADLVAGVVRRTVADQLSRKPAGAVRVDHLLARDSVLPPADSWGTAPERTEGERGSGTHLHRM
jgi:hypothetical protein